MGLKRHIIFWAVLLLVSSGRAAAAQAERVSPAIVRCSAHSVAAPQRGTLASDAERVYVGSTAGALTAYSVGNLAIEWRLELGGEFASEILTVDKGLAVVTNPIADGTSRRNGSTLRLVAGDSGVVAWSSDLPFSEKYYIGRLNGKLAAVSQDGTVSLIELSSGRVVSRSAPYGPVAARPVFREDRMAFGSAKKQLIVISAGGTSAAMTEMELIPRTIAFASDGDLLTGDERGNVQHFHLPDGRSAWKFKTGAAVSSLVETDGGILATSLDNFVYLISDYNGNVIWKRRLPGRIVDSGLRLNGYFIVLINGENTGYALDLANGRVVDTLTASESDLIGGSAVRLRDNTFAVTTTNGLETYAVGDCGSKRTPSVTGSGAFIPMAIPLSQ